jgi:hypothetical protein
MNTVTYLPKCGNAHNAAATTDLVLKGAHPPGIAIVPFLENTCTKQPLTSLNSVVQSGSSLLLHYMCLKQTFAENYLVLVHTNFNVPKIQNVRQDLNPFTKLCTNSVNSL